MTEKKSVFETTGAFNQYYNAQNMGNPTLAVPLDVAKSVPTLDRAKLQQIIEKKNVAPQMQQQPEEGYVQRIFNGINKVLDFAHQVSAFALTTVDSKNPIYNEGFNFDAVKKSWDAASKISAGQAFQRAGAKVIPGINLIDNFSSAVKTVSGGKLSGFDRFMEDHLLYLTNDFDIYDQQQRKTAFEEQAIGRWASGTTDVIAAFVLDPTFIAGKAYKGVRAAQFAVKGVKELDQVLSGVKTGRRAERIRNSFLGFIEDTDGMDVKDLIRVKAIRESANPTGLSEIIAKANTIDDVALRHQTKTDIMRLAMGDTAAGVRLLEQQPILAAKLASLQDEVLQAKYFGAGLDKTTGQATLNFLNEGGQYDNLAEMVKEVEGEVLDNFKKFEIAGSLAPDTIPNMTLADSLRVGAANSQRIIDLRTGLTGAQVRFFTNFFYKTPRSWIDFTDNQSIQTVDNMLNQVRNITARQEAAYVDDIAAGKRALAAATDDVAKAKARQQIKNAEDALKLSTFTVERRSALLTKYAEAAGPNERAKVFQEIEQELFSTVARQFGYTDDAARQAYGMWSTNRQRVRNMLQERAYTGARTEVDGFAVPVGSKIRPIVDEDGVANIIPAPILETQLVHKLPTLDVGTMYAIMNRSVRAEKFGKVYKAYGKTKNSVDELLGTLDSIFKFQALARLGYPVRSVTEGTMRVMSVSGPMAILNRYVNGAVDLATKFTTRPMKEIFEEKAKVQLAAELDQLKTAVDLVDDPTDMLQRMKEIEAMLSGKAPIQDKFGTGLLEIAGVKYQDALGLTPEAERTIRDMFVRNAGQITDDMFQELHRTNKQFMELTGDWVVIRGTEAGWEDAYLRVVNRQIRNSKMSKILLQSRKSPEQIVNELEDFLLRNPEGRKIMKDLGMGRDARGLAEANVQNIQHLFNGVPELLDIAAKRDLTADDLAKSIFARDAVLRPDVNGAQVANATGVGVIARGWSNMLKNFYEYVGEAPERVLVNHPMFVDLYRKRMSSLVQNAIETYPEDTIPASFLRKLENQSRQWARSELRRTVYDTSESIEAAKYMRFIFPFFRSFADTAQKWSRIVLNDPSVAASLNIVYNAPDRSGLVEERDGVKYINVPGEWVKKFKVFGDRPLQIPKTSLNLIFSGNSWWNPGAGWFVQVPLNKIMKNMPELERNAAVKEILPFGATGTGWSDVFIQSPAAKRVIRIFDTDSPERNNMTVLVMAEENFRFESGQRSTRPTAEEVEDRVKKMLAIEAASRLLLPFATNSRSPYQFYIDEFHRMREEDPATAAERFYDAYGDDYYAFTTSLSKNNTGVAASIEADKEATRLKDLIAKNPEYGWFIIGDKNGGEFSPTVYQRQRELSVQPGGKTKYRESQDPYAAYDETLAEKGWIVYNKGMDILNAQLIARGLKSFQSRGAEDLNAAREAFIADLEAENDAWREARGTINTKKVENFLKFAQRLLDDDRVNKRQDMVTLDTYLQGRNFIVDQLDLRGGTINNPQNADLKERWDAFVMELIDQDVTFSRIYTRILERDDLSKRV